MPVSLSTANANPSMLRSLSKLPRSRIAALGTRSVSGSVRAAQQESGAAAGQRADVPVKRSGRPRQTSMARPYNRLGTMTPFSLTSGLAPVLPTRFDSIFRYAQASRNNFKDASLHMTAPCKRLVALLSIV
jgi:hypothetical protein